MKKLLSLGLCIGLFLGITGCGGNTIETAGYIFGEFRGNEIISEYIVNSKEFKKNENLDEIMGEDTQYISKISWQDSRVYKVDGDKYNGGSIELFENKKSAKIRKETLEYYSNELIKTINEDEYGEFAKSANYNNKKVHQKGNAIITVSDILTDGEAKEYFDLFDKAIGDYDFEQKDTPSKEEIEELSNEYTKKIDEMILDIKNKTNDNLNLLADETENRIITIESSLNESDLTKIEFDLEKYSVPYFADKYSVWKDRITNIKVTIENNRKADEERIAAEKIRLAEEATASVGRQNASKKAASYLRSSSFSYTRLIEQLIYEGFTEEQSTYAADNCGTNWNEQSAKKAQSYMKSSSFSRQGLIDQLLYEGFSQEQAEFGASSVGY